MSPSGMHLHFYSLTLHKLKLVSWARSFVVAPTAGFRLSAEAAPKTFPSYHLIQGLDLITDWRRTTSATAVQSSFLLLLNLHNVDGILVWDSFNSPSFQEHNRNVLQHRLIYYHQQPVLRWNGSGVKLIAFKNPLKMTFSSCHLSAAVLEQYTVLFFTPCLRCHVSA